jgi:hypothetical protein
MPCPCSIDLSNCLWVMEFEVCILRVCRAGWLLLQTLASSLWQQGSELSFFYAVFFSEIHFIEGCWPWSSFHTMSHSNHLAVTSNSIWLLLLFILSHLILPPCNLLEHQDLFYVMYCCRLLPQGYSQNLASASTDPALWLYVVWAEESYASLEVFNFPHSTWNSD